MVFSWGSFWIKARALSRGIRQRAPRVVSSSCTPRARGLSLSPLQEAHGAVSKRGWMVSRRVFFPVFAIFAKAWLIPIQRTSIPSYLKKEGEPFKIIWRCLTGRS